MVQTTFFQRFPRGHCAQGRQRQHEREHGRLRFRHLVAVARAGLLPDTVTNIARLAQVEESIVRHCLLQAELSALMVLCKASGFANTTFTTLLKLRSGNTGETVALVTMLHCYEAMQRHTAKRISQFAEKKKRSASAAAATAAE
jgi:hypothetical protein